MAKDHLMNTISDNFGASGSAIANIFKTTSSNTLGLIDKIAAVATAAATVVSDVSRFMTTKDMGAIIQSFSVSNGMKVMYPELWSNATYSKNMSFSFTFTSPYGDPASIFKYVYVPFCALACLALPRQAAENGFVSPMFVRADIPGMVTSDLALISSFSFTKGGSQNLWTKDGLPRSIEVSITISDLYPYLSMVSDYASLSSNPSYAVFLDNMSGLMVMGDEDDDALNS